jgi:hypothetical protein
MDGRPRTQRTDLRTTYRHTSSSESTEDICVEALGSWNRQGKVPSGFDRRASGGNRVATASSEDHRPRGSDIEGWDACRKAHQSGHRRLAAAFSLSNFSSTYEATWKYQTREGARNSLKDSLVFRQVHFGQRKEDLVEGVMEADLTNALANYENPVGLFHDRGVQPMGLSTPVGYAKQLSRRACSRQAGPRWRRKPRKC